MKKTSILFIDIPELNELAERPEDFILLAKWKTEDIISGKEYARHMSGVKYSRGLLTLASYIRQKGFSPAYVSINDVSQKALERKIARTDVVGIPASNTPFIPKVTKIVSLVKKINSKIPVIVGGYHATFQDKELLKENHNIDIVVRGEGEVTFYEVLKNYPTLEKVAGITFRKGKKIIHNPDRELLSSENTPLPAYDLLPQDLNNYSIKIQTTRGCLFRCAFCVNPVFWKEVRPAPIEKVVEELLFFKQKLKPGTHIHFTDNIFTWNKKRAIEICHQITKRKLPFAFSADIRTGFLDKEILEVLKEANFTQLMIGFEDTSDKILQKVAKKQTYQQCVATAKLIKKYSDIIVTAYWIVGLPGCTYESLHKTLNQARCLLRKNIVDIVCSALFVPVPGTPVFEESERFGVSLTSKNWGDYFRCRMPAVYRLEKLDEQELADYYLLFETSVLMEYCRKLRINPFNIAGF